MKQVLQDLKTGKTFVEDVPTPQISSKSILIKSTKSLISAGTEKMLVEFGKGSLIQKAKSQPDKVKQVLDKIKTDGLMPTVEAVFAKLGEPMPLGYCNVGRIVELGSDIEGYKLGQRVISNGPHAEYVAVGKNLTAAIPDNVSDEEASFTVIGSIGLQGIRLANPEIGDTVFVVGLGLIGLVTAQLLQANGCRVIGSDYDQQRLKMAQEFGCEVVDLSSGVNPVDYAMASTGGHGVDSVIVTAATKSNAPMQQAAQMSRKRGKIILVGVTGLELNRADFYEKELTFQVSCSYGPGRYDSTYELHGQDYPIGYVKWTEQRNFEAILQLISSGKLNLKPLITDTFEIENAEQAYDKVLGAADSLGILLSYPEDKEKVEVQDRQVSVNIQSKPDSKCTAGIIGAGNFTRLMVLPALQKSECSMKVISSSNGVSGTIAAKKFNIPVSTTDTDSIIKNEKVNTIFITTRHDSHAKYILSGLKENKHVFVEKPMALTIDEMREIHEYFQNNKNNDKQFMVGYNRRFSPHMIQMKKLLESSKGPACITYNVNAGAIPKSSWVHDPKIGGGRIIGEGCHFIDAIRFLTGSKLVSVFANMVENATDGIQDDKMTILLKYENGSIGTVNYWANGTKLYMKEHIICYNDGKILEMQNFRNTKGFGYRGFTQFKTKNQDKGHSQEFSSFCSSVSKGGKALISYDELLESNLASFAAIESAKNGQIQLMNDWFKKLV